MVPCRTHPFRATSDVWSLAGSNRRQVILSETLERGHAVVSGIYHSHQQDCLLFARRQPKPFAILIDLPIHGAITPVTA